MLEAIQQAMNMDTIGAITSTIFIILIGYFARRTEFFNEHASRLLSNIVLKLSLPALSFTSFMMDFDREILSRAGVIFIWSFLIYFLLMPLMKGVYAAYSGEEKNTLETISMYGSKTFFGTPVVAAVYGQLAVLYANVFMIGYRIMMYTHGNVKLSGIKITKDNWSETLRAVILDPAIIATLLGVIIWVFQGSMPQVAVSTAEGVQNVAFLRIDQTAPWLMQPLTYLAGLSSPLAWLSIGAQLGEANIVEALKDKTSWYYTFIKGLAIPTFNLIAMFVINQFVQLDFSTVATTTILMSAPTAATISAMGIAQGGESARITSWAASISTFGTVITIPFWIIILSIVNGMGIFL